jgi:hypothetical protein
MFQQKIQKNRDRTDDGSLNDGGRAMKPKRPGAIAGCPRFAGKPALSRNQAKGNGERTRPRVLPTGALAGMLNYYYRQAA